MISESLMHTKNAGVPMEYLHPFALRYLSRPLTLAVILEYFADLVTRRTSPNGVFGMKLHFDQFRLIFMKQGRITEEGRDFLRSFDKIILLSRSDKIAQAISSMLAERNQKWTSHDKDDHGNQNWNFIQSDVPIIINHLNLVVRDCLAWQDVVTRLGLETLDVTYEQLLERPNAEFKKILGFLGLPIVDIVPKTVRLSLDGHQRSKELFLREIGVNVA